MIFPFGPMSITPALQGCLSQLRHELQDYANRVRDIRANNRQEDLRIALRRGISHETVCQWVELHENGLEGIFSQSKLLSRGRFGKILPPLRHPEFCFKGEQCFVGHELSHSRFCDLVPTIDVPLSHYFY